MKRNTKVHFVLNGHAGEGITIADEFDGHICIAVTSEGERCHVLYVETDKVLPGDMADEDAETTLG